MKHAKRLVLMRTRTLGKSCTVRDYQLRSMTWKQSPRGTWVAWEGLKKLATVGRTASGYYLSYSYSSGPSHHCSGGCRKDTAEACKELFESIYSGGLRAVCAELTREAKL